MVFLRPLRRVPSDGAGGHSIRCATTRRGRALVAAAVVLLGALAFLTLANSTENATANAEHRAARLQAALDHLLAANPAATSALARVQDEQEQWVGSAGVPDLTSAQPADPAGRFRIGSVTKTFTAALLLQLVDEGRITLDDPIDQHLPGLVPGGDRITIRQILNHTSGLRDPAGQPRDTSPQARLAAAFAEQTPVAPGTSWAYANTNYLLAGTLIEKITGESYEQQLTSRILNPLGLTHTSPPTDDPAIPEPHAHGYSLLPAAPGREPELRDVTGAAAQGWAAGGMISTTADLNRFFDALLGGELLTEASLAAMRDMVALDDPSSQPSGRSRYGLGLSGTELSCGITLWGHSGGVPGFTTYAVRADDGRQLSVSLNGSSQIRRPSSEGDMEDAALTNLYEIVYCDR